jgi:hypothetical protein
MVIGISFQIPRRDFVRNTVPRRRSQRDKTFLSRSAAALRRPCVSLSKMGRYQRDRCLIQLAALAAFDDLMPKRKEIPLGTAEG